MASNQRAFQDRLREYDKILRQERAFRIRAEELLRRGMEVADRITARVSQAMRQTNRPSPP